MKKIFLFDMDGTLTPARKKMGWEITNYLSDLQKIGFEIGILSGSDLDYVVEQCNVLLDLNPVDWKAIHWLPCNGTKYYRFDKKNKLMPLYENDMRIHIGEKRWRRLIQLLLNLQSAISRVHRKIPLTDTFIQYRGSTINWCPIGRSASDSDRNLWLDLNQNNKIREQWITIAKSGFESANLKDVVIKYGGETSYDIYPVGWDKTYAWKNFDDYDEIHFMGDSCEPSGNDYEAFIKARQFGYSTSGPEETINILSKILDS